MLFQNIPYDEDTGTDNDSNDGWDDSWDSRKMPCATANDIRIIQLIRQKNHKHFNGSIVQTEIVQPIVQPIGQPKLFKQFNACI